MITLSMVPFPQVLYLSKLCAIGIITCVDVSCLACAILNQAPNPNNHLNWRAL